MRNTRVSPAYAENGPGTGNRSMATTRSPRAASCQVAMLPTEPAPTTMASASTTVTVSPPAPYLADHISSTVTCSVVDLAGGESGMAPLFGGKDGNGDE